MESAQNQSHKHLELWIIEADYSVKGYIIVITNIKLSKCRLVKNCLK